MTGGGGGQRGGQPASRHFQGLALVLVNIQVHKGHRHRPTKNSISQFLRIARQALG